MVSGVIWTATLRNIVEEVTYYTMDTFVWTGCGFAYFLMYFGFTFSSALLVILSVEKFIALYFPLQTKSVCTVSMARRLSLITAVIYIGLNSQFFLIGKKINESGKTYCFYGNVSWDYLIILFSAVLSSLYSYIPFIIMILANFAIIYKFMAAKFRQDGGRTQSTSQALSKSASTGTAMLLTVSFTFIILTAPTAAANAFWTEGIPEVYYMSFGALQNLNHGINGILYCVVGSRFRNELRKLFKCGTKGSRPSSRLSSRTLSSSVLTYGTGDSSSFPTVASTASPI